MSVTKKKRKRFIIGAMLFFVLCLFLVFCADQDIIISNGKVVE